MTPTWEARFWAKVHKTDSCWVWVASKSSNGYGSFSINGRTRSAHRIAYALVHGAVPEGLFVDHICHNRACVRPEHLRLTSCKENGENRRGAPANSASGVRGVTWCSRQSLWKASVKHEGRSVHAGYFGNLEDAAEAATAKRNELFTHNELDRVPV